MEDRTRSDGSRADAGDSDPGDAESVSGRWAKLGGGGCAERYPDVVEFLGGTYLGTKGPGQGFVLWDAGIYRRLAPDRIRIQIATDELVTYPCSVSADLLTVLDEHGCRLEYRRLRAGDRGGVATTTDDAEEEEAH